MRRLNAHALRRWTQLGLVRTGLLETPQQRGQHEMLEHAFTLTGFSGVEGDYLEFGVFRGDNFVNAWHAARRCGRAGIGFYAFDSFRGLPDPGASSVDTDGEFSAGQFAASRAEFERTIQRGGVNGERVKVVEGFYEDTLRVPPSSLGLRAASVVWIDCDLYQSAALALDFVTELLQDGSVLVFDDWHCFRTRPDRGEQRACAEWLARNPAVTLVPYRDFHWAGRSFVVHRTPSAG